MITLLGPALEKIDRSDPIYKSIAAAHPRLVEKDPEIWGPAAAAEASVRLNWVDLDESSRQLLPVLDAVAAKFREQNNLVLCGMGGSSLAPEVIAKTFGKSIFILDSTDPDYLAHALQGSAEKLLVIVSSKSGSTIETSSQRAFFERYLTQSKLDPTQHMVFVTDPDSPLDKDARAKGFTVINADPKVGGRSLDVAYLLLTQNKQFLGFTDYSSNFPGLSDWIEQLIAESTGKDEKGRLPIATASFSEAASGGAFSVGFAEGAQLSVIAELGEHFLFWEWVTALMGAALAIDPFNQPNVTEAKEATSAVLKEWGNKLPLLLPSATDEQVEIFGDGNTLTASLKNLIATTDSDGYIAIMAYLDRKDDAAIIELRSILSEKSGRPVSFGWGPRFLHSTGQFHKGGQQNGSFLQITGNTKRDFDVPGREFTFATLLMAQALGDSHALRARKYPLLRLNLSERSAGISQLIKAANAL